MGEEEAERKGRDISGKEEVNTKGRDRTRKREREDVTEREE